MNRNTRVKEKSRLPFPLIKDLLIAKKHLEKLRHLGNYHHNLTVLEVLEGELIVSRRPSTTKRCNPNDFLPCKHCLSFIRRQELWKHVKLCKFKPENIETSKYQKVQEKSKLLLYPAFSTDSRTTHLSKILATMKNDEVSIVARNDWLIKEIGFVFFEKYGEKQNSLISQKMRELSRLLLQLRETDASANSSLSDFIKPGRFDDVVSAVKSISKFQFEKGVQDVATPSLSLKISHSLKKCVNILRGHALRTKDNILLKLLLGTVSLKQLQFVFPATGKMSSQFVVLLLSRLTRWSQISPVPSLLYF